MDQFFDPAWFQRLLLVMPVILLSITVHELSHGLAAWRFGDPTARMQGRLTMNPLKHLDVLGTLTLIITQLIGWAKPVPVDPRYFRDPRRQMMWVALAGPASNIALAVCCALVFHLLGTLEFQSEWAYNVAVPIYLMAQYGVMINIALAIFNMLPIPPLDGGRVVTGLLPLDMARKYASIEPYGFMIVLALVLVGLTGQVIRPFIRLFMQLLGVG